MLTRRVFAKQQLELLGTIKASLEECKPLLEGGLISYEEVTERLENLISYWKGPKSELDFFIKKALLFSGLEGLQIHMLVYRDAKPEAHRPEVYDSCRKTTVNAQKDLFFQPSASGFIFLQSLVLSGISTAIKRLLGIVEAKFTRLFGLSYAIQMVFQTLSLVSLSNRISTWYGMLVSTFVHLFSLQLGITPQYARQAATIAAITTTAIIEEPEQILGVCASFAGSAIGVMAADKICNNNGSILTYYYHSTTMQNELLAEGLDPFTHQPVRLR